MKIRGWEKIAHLLEVRFNNAKYPQIPYYYYNDRRVIMKNEIDKNLPCSPKTTERYMEKSKAEKIKALSSDKFEVYYLDVLLNYWIKNLIHVTNNKVSTAVYKEAVKINTFIDSYTWQYKYHDKLPEDINSDLEKLEVSHPTDNTTSSKPPETKQLGNVVFDDADEGNINKLRKLKADADKAEQSAQIEKLKRLELENNLISSENVKRAQIEQAVIYITNYQNDKKLLPTKLVGMSKNEIRKTLDTHYEKRVKDLNKLIDKRKVKATNKFYDLIEVALELLKDNDVEELINRIKNLKC